MNGIVPNTTSNALTRSLTTIDLEGDFDLDTAVVANNDLGERVVQILRNDLSGGQLIFAEADELAAGENPVFVTTGDLDADNQDDLITVNEQFGAAPCSFAADRGSQGAAAFLKSPGAGFGLCRRNVTGGGDEQCTVYIEQHRPNRRQPLQRGRSPCRNRLQRPGKLFYAFDC